MRFVLDHHHAASDCRLAHAAWRGVEHRLAPVRMTCLAGGHEIRWVVEAPDARTALALLPEWVAARTRVGASDASPLSASTGAPEREPRA